MAKTIKESNKKIDVERLQSVIVLVLSGSVVILALLGLLNIIPGEITSIVTYPMLAIALLINGVKTYKTNKAAGIFMMLCVVLIFITFFI